MAQCLTILLTKLQKNIIQKCTLNRDKHITVKVSISLTKKETNNTMTRNSHFCHTFFPSSINIYIKPNT